MYNDYYVEEKRRFPIRSVLVKMVIIILIIMLLIWILPSSLFDGSKKVMDENINKLKNASLTYYTKDRLPEVGNESSISLKKLQELKLVDELKNKKGDICNVDESYSNVKARENDYLLTINLTCGETKEKREIILNHYDYCDSYLCEKNEKLAKAGVPSCELEVTKGELGVYDWYRSDVEVSFKEKNAKEGLKIKEYGLSLNKDYNSKDKYIIKEDGTFKVIGYVKDNRGKESTCSITINKDTKKPTCELMVLNGNKNSNGTYYGDVSVGFKSKEDDLSGIDIYGISDTKEELFNEDKEIIVESNGKKTIYGHVKDKAGNTNTCSITINKTNSNEGSVISNNNNVNIINKSNNGNNNLKNNKSLSCSLTVNSGTLGKNNIYTTDVVIKFKNITTYGTKVVGYGLGTSVNYNKNTTYKITKEGSTTVYGYVKDNRGNTTRCSINIKKNTSLNGIKYEYAKLIPNTYSSWSSWTTSTYNLNNKPAFYKSDTRQVEDLGKKTTTSWKYSTAGNIYLSQIHEVKTLTEKVCKGYNYYRLGSTTYGVKTSEAWVYAGKVKYNSTPVETMGIKYTFDSLSWNCGSCTTPDVIWKKYTRSAVNVNNLNCSSKTGGKVIVTNQYREVVGFNQSRSLVNNVSYSYRYRTRKITKTGYTDYKYSTSKNDKGLINNGYKLTGKIFK